MMVNPFDSVIMTAFYITVNMTVKIFFGTQKRHFFACLWPYNCSKLFPVSQRLHLHPVLRAKRRAEGEELFEHGYLITAVLALGTGTAAVHAFGVGHFECGMGIRAKGLSQCL
jgi:hypothetical protein